MYSIDKLYINIYVIIYKIYIFYLFILCPFYASILYILDTERQPNDSWLLKYNIVYSKKNKND